MDFINRREMNQGLGEFGLDAQPTMGEMTGVSQDYYCESRGMWVYWSFDDGVWIDSVHNDVYTSDEIDLPIPTQTVSDIKQNPMSYNSQEGSGFTKGLATNRNIIIALAAATTFLIFKGKGKK